MVHTVAFGRVEDRKLQDVSRTCLPSTFKTTRVTTHNAAISTLTVAVKT